MSSSMTETLAQFRFLTLLNEQIVFPRTQLVLFKFVFSLDSNQKRDQRFRKQKPNKKLGRSTKLYISQVTNQNLKSNNAVL